MKKTTVYLPNELKLALAQVATRSGNSEAEIIRIAIAEFIRAATPPRPKGGLFNGEDPGLSESTDTALTGFGDR